MTTFLSVVMLCHLAQPAAAGLEAPALLTPAAGAESVVFHPHFDWQTVAGAEAYRVQVGREDGSDDAGALVARHRE